MRGGFGAFFMKYYFNQLLDKQQTFSKGTKGLNQPRREIIAASWYEGPYSAYLCRPHLP